jgi:NADH dehydrogenase
VSDASVHRVVIVGGGAGGLPLATRLGERFGRRGRADVTLVDQNATHLWKPLLHEVAAGRMDADAHDLDYLAIAHWHHFRFRQGAVTGIDRARRELTVSEVRDDDGAAMLPARVLRYDTLIVCVGSISNDFRVPGVAEHAAVLDTLRDAERFHRRLLSACVRADARAAEGTPTGVSIVIIGAGATGVELAAEIRHTTAAHAAYGLEKLDARRDIRLTLVEAAPRILATFPASLARKTKHKLERMGVEVREGSPVEQIDEQIGRAHV